MLWRVVDSVRRLLSCYRQLLHYVHMHGRCCRTCLSPLWAELTLQQAVCADAVWAWLPADCCNLQLESSSHEDMWCCWLAEVLVLSGARLGVGSALCTMVCKGHVVEAAWSKSSYSTLTEYTGTCQIWSNVGRNDSAYAQKHTTSPTLLCTL